MRVDNFNQTIGNTPHVYFPRDAHTPAKNQCITDEHVAECHARRLIQHPCMALKQRLLESKRDAYYQFSD